MSNKIRIVGAVLVIGLWAVLTAFVWFGPQKEMSDAERRKLAQFPELSVETLLSGEFMTDFEDYTLDQFPGRDTFRKLKSMFHYYVMGQKDNNDIYLADGYAAVLEYPLKPDDLNYALGRFNLVYDRYFKDSGSRIYASVIPDKGYYLAEENGYPAMDYEDLFSQVQQQMPWATYVDITDCLNAQSYYYTDTHWRQEKILPVAEKLGKAMGVSVAGREEYTQTQLERPFYGVYYGQAALPMDAEPMYLMESALLSQCRVFNYNTQSYTDVYDREKLGSKDLYDVFLSGPQPLLRIENPNATTDRELIVFRESFGSSVAPLLVQEYKTVTLVDIRYISSEMLGMHMEFTGQDVLFLYSTLVLNNGTTVK